MKANRGGWRMIRREQLMEQVRHDAYKAKGKLPEPTRCPDCGAVFENGRWVWGTAPQGAHEERCPACHRIHDRCPAGYITIAGGYVGGHREELLARARNVESREKAEHALERIIAVEDGEDGVVVTTTSVHLARAIGDALADAYKGELEYHYNDAENLLRVHWARAQ